MRTGTLPAKETVVLGSQVAKSPLSEVPSSITPYTSFMIYQAVGYVKLKKPLSLVVALNTLGG